MCGISAIATKSDTIEKRVLVSTMMKKLEHRGPDNQSMWISSDSTVTFGHNRLSIIDPTPEGNQPFHSKDGRYVLIWNGEIYNHKELKLRLENLGKVFQTESDSEVLVEAFAYWGEDAFSRFKGMWSILIWDNELSELIVCRDRFGIKPLYYAAAFGGFVFASEQKAIRCLDQALNEIDEEMVSLFVNTAKVINGHQTFFKQIKCFPPGHFSKIRFLDENPTSTQITFRSYWSLSPQTKYIASDRRQLRDRLSRAVKEHLTSDVPVAAALSGGLDSSAVCGLIVRQEDYAFNKLHTFTVVWPENPAINEEKWARIGVDAFGTDSDWIVINKLDFLEELDKIIYYQDEPFASTTIVAQYFLYREVSQTKYRVVLDGQGADELFLGYQGLILNFLMERLSRGQILQVVKDLILLSIYRKTMRLDLGLLVRQMTVTGLMQVRNRISRNSTSVQSNLEEVRHDLIFGGNLESLLKYQDRNSMAFSIESRVPFLDHELVEAVLSQDPLANWRDVRTKSLLRDAMTEILPNSLRLRRDKFGYTTPESEWLEMIFGQTSAGLDSRAWREFIVARWRNLITAGDKDSDAF